MEQQTAQSKKGLLHARSLQYFSSPWLWHFSINSSTDCVVISYEPNFPGSVLGEIGPWSFLYRSRSTTVPNVKIFGARSSADYCPNLTLTSMQCSTCTHTFISSRFPCALWRSPTLILLCFTLPILNIIGTESGLNDWAPVKIDGQSAPSVFILIAAPMLC